MKLHEHVSEVVIKTDITTSYKLYKICHYDNISSIILELKLTNRLPKLSKNMKLQLFNSFDLNVGFIYFQYM